MLENVTLSEPVRELLEAALVEERDLVAGILQDRPTELAEEPGLHLCHSMVAVRRVLDLETAELRRLEVYLHPSGEGWEVVRVAGLDPSLEDL